MKYLLYIFVLTLPLFARPLFEFSGHRFRLNWIIILLILLVFLFTALRSRARLKGKKYIYLFTCFGVLSALSLLTIGIHSKGGEVIGFLTLNIQFYVCFVIFFVFYNLNTDERFLKQITKLYIVTALAVSAVGVIQFIMANVSYVPTLRNIVGFDWYGNTGYQKHLGLRRSTSIFKEPRHYGSWLVTPFIIVAYHKNLRDNLINRTLARYSKYVIALGLLVSFSASAYFSLAAALAIYILLKIYYFGLNNQSTFIYLYSSAFAVMVVWIGSSLLQGDILKPFSFVFGRFMLTEYEQKHLFDLSVHLYGVPRYIRGFYTSLEIFAKNPFLGVGSNQFSVYFDKQFVLPIPFVMALAEEGFAKFSILMYLVSSVLPFNSKENDVRIMRSVSVVSALIILVALVQTLTLSRYAFNSVWFWFQISFGYYLFRVYRDKYFEGYYK